MSEAFRTDAEVAVPRLAHIAGCSCPLHQRRLFGAALLAGGASAALPALAQQPQEGVKGEVGKTSPFARLVPAEQVEQAAAAQYAQMTREAAGERALMPASHPQVVRLRAIAERLVPHTYPWNPRARGWRWEVNLIGNEALNAFCMPGGKIAFFYGILQRLQLTDAEVAAIMGHEMAHALREHARERMGKTFATRAGASLVSSLLGLGSLGDTALGMGAQMLTLKFSREDESEADVVGLELAARGGYDPAAGLSLWRKMMRASQGAPPEFLSTHPAGDSRLRDIGRVLTKVEPLYARADKPRQAFGPPRG